MRGRDGHGRKRQATWVQPTCVGRGVVRADLCEERKCGRRAKRRLRDGSTGRSGDDPNVHSGPGICGKLRHEPRLNAARPERPRQMARQAMRRVGVGANNGGAHTVG
jgi:hypothetical protein